MLELDNINKRFRLKDAKQSNQLCADDPRVSGRFFYALKNVSINCKAAEVVALLGANGAGKTTLLRVLSTALAADSGQIKLNGQEIKQNKLKYRKSIGFLSGTTGLYARLSGYENLQYFSNLYGLDKAQGKVRIDTLIKKLNMQDFIHRRFDDYSTGMKQKVAIARAVLHNPDFVILDEPTTGLDIRAREVILNFIETLKNEGVGVIFSTHDLAEVERLCQRIYIVEQGQVRFSGDIQQLMQHSQSDSLFDAVLQHMEVAHD
ncbi:ABC transporter ATP-binding protein [Catenovulum sediminis]|uniref:ABC transporter ATP-binding protein n=1 Tax=Catenovulum sediminis TaxID=1740262 RepID=A0ABV1RC23_9ALTE|nr:ABC transporter ATP-binding protein [Catenovulum sediminis]